MLFDCVATTTTTIIIICSIRRFGGILSSSRVADVKVNWLLTDILLIQLLHETMGRRRGEKGSYRNLFSSYYNFFFFWLVPLEFAHLLLRFPAVWHGLCRPVAKDMRRSSQGGSLA